MFESIELLNGYLRVTPIVFIIDLIFLFLFLYSWYINCLKKRYLIDFWHSVLIVQFLMMLIIGYPFMGSYKTLLVRPHIKLSFDMYYVDWAYFINLIGFIFVFLAAYIYSKGIRINFIDDIIEFLYKKINCTLTIISDTKFFGKIFALCLMFALFVIIYLVIEGNRFFDLRGIALLNGQIRWVANLFFVCILPTFIVLSLYLILTKQNNIIILLLLLFGVFELIVFGARGEIISSIVVCISVYLIKNKLTLRIFYKSVSILLVLSVLFFSLEFVRESYRRVPNENRVNPIVKLYYGNNLSDIRDCALILEHWDGKYLYGKNILAGLMFFVPREYSEYRNTWATSRYTNRLVGASDAHAGYRMGLFGEMFLTFGIIGVGIWGFLWGYVIKRLDCIVKANNENKNFIKIIFSAYLVYELLFGLMFHLSLGWYFWIKLIVFLSIIFLYERRII